MAFQHIRDLVEFSLVRHRLDACSLCSLFPSYIVRERRGVAMTSLPYSTRVTCARGRLSTPIKTRESNRTRSDKRFAFVQFANDDSAQLLLSGLFGLYAVEKYILSWSKRETSARTHRQ